MSKPAKNSDELCRFRNVAQAAVLPVSQAHKYDLDLTPIRSDVGEHFELNLHYSRAANTTRRDARLSSSRGHFEDGFESF